ncbi:putative stage II sporulation protein [Labilithrix luteola]|uniref:Putative stage II sporulation protein n=1 Tax=Labilithrix luteola TaxID=1391654 RepID=A0A0K1Q343_9BACT|nr:GAF domain-containing protein [Labilithrix luteola]AKU99794.1 putative stage II sporulation protein [Labilithrix luteola]
MRWLVEVSSLEKTDLQKFCVEAESWQRALQAARAQRGEEGPMSGFSIELLEEGYRAVDPIARIRFVVKRAPHDMPVTTVAIDSRLGVAPGAPSSISVPPVVITNDPTSTGQVQKISVTPAPAPAPAGSPSKMPSQPPARTSVTLAANTVAIAEAKAEAREQEAVGGRAAPPAVGSAIPGLPAVKLLTSREQNPTDASPLSYREYAFAVPAGTTEESAVEVLRAQLRIVDAHLAGLKVGKLVNLAVFDVEFTGKPPRPPIATLTWKDWKGEPVLGYPARGTGSSAPLRPPSKIPPSLAAPATTPSGNPTPAAVANAVIPPAPAVPNIGASNPAPNAAATAAPAPVVVPAPEPIASVTEPMLPPSSASGAASVSSSTSSAATKSANGPSAPAPAATDAEPRRSPSQPPAGAVKTPSGRLVRGRVSGDELITALFESMHDLHFLRDALDGGQFCLALATEVLPARAALIHFFDIEKREWVVACARGKDTRGLLALRTADADEILRDAARKRRAVVVANASTAAGERYRQIGGSHSLIVAPIMQAGRALGALEIINPLDGLPFTEDEAYAMTYIAEQYAEYLGSRGIVLDRDRIHSSATAGA